MGPQDWWCTVVSCTLPLYCTVHQPSGDWTGRVSWGSDWDNWIFDNLVNCQYHTFTFTEDSNNKSTTIKGGKHLYENYWSLKDIIGNSSGTWCFGLLDCGYWKLRHLDEADFFLGLRFSKIRRSSIIDQDRARKAISESGQKRVLLILFSVSSFSLYVVWVVLVPM